MTGLTVWTKYLREIVESVDGNISDAKGIVAKKKMLNQSMKASPMLKGLWLKRKC